MVVVFYVFKNNLTKLTNTWLNSPKETIENECITFEIYLDAKERVIFSLYDWGYSITYRLSENNKPF